MRSPSHIVMVGTSFETRSDTGAALRAYRDAGLFGRWPVDYVVSHREGSWLVRALKALDGLLVFFAMACRHPRAVLHVHSASGASFWRKALFMALAMLARWPVVFHLHGAGFATFYDVQCGPVRRAIVRFFLDRADCVVVVSQRWCSWMTRVTRANVVCIATPVHLPEPLAARDPALIACAAEGEGAREVEQAVATLAARYPGLRVEPASGRGVLGRATAFVMPAPQGGIAPVLQAMAAGCPVIACATGSVPDVVDNGFNGLLVPPRDADAIAQALGRLLAQPAFAREMGRAARATIASRFSADRATEQVGRIYARLGVEPEGATPRAEPTPARLSPFRLQES